ncbi:DUF29 family protein [Methylobacterium nodulans]|uniref:DUF29 domain-containing protein n=1 Tax=Methylobacterium nodulans (strain LMG 21967 / CNCM I-2342 / ORS 2060) TaxID=460265 RepID=B8ISZ9_METNO|nr:DUF29 family protein [Methylobacterium nodulans]ACL55061.1 protein of unknown function DUF29 [Methylobacterium nodulans ORS 2060]
MDQPPLYEEDIVTWAEQQASALRSLAARPDLSNALDWDAVAEEIEEVGASRIRATASALLLVLVHVLKYVSAPTAQSTRSWRAEVITFQTAARGLYTRSTRQRIDWDDLWRSAKRNADASLHIHGDSLIEGLPEQMPFTPEELVAPDFDMDAALSRLGPLLAPTGGRRRPT